MPSDKYLLTLEIAVIVITYHHYVFVVLLEKTIYYNVLTMTCYGKNAKAYEGKALLELYLTILYLVCHQEQFCAPVLSCHSVNTITHHAKYADSKCAHVL